GRTVSGSSERSGCRAVKGVGPLFKSFGEHAEGAIKHRAHQRAEHAALELVVDEEADLSTATGGRFEAPSVNKIRERPVDVFDVDAVVRRLKHHLAGERLADRLVADGHVSHE